MTHINRARMVRRLSYYTLSDFIRDGNEQCSFAVFNGTANQRDAVIRACIARTRGTRGVVILHDDPIVDQQLGALKAGVPERQNVIAANRPGQYCYDPLYGYGREDVLNMLVPYEAAGAAAPALMQMRSALQDYLTILEFQYHRNRTQFGESPYNLDLLMTLTSWSYDELERRVLNYMRDDSVEMLRTRLSDAGNQQSVWYAVSNYARKMEQHLWKQSRQWVEHTRNSLISAAHNRDIISVRVPASDSELLRLLSVELNAIVRNRIPLLLVVAGLRSERDDPLKMLLTRQRSSEFAVGISSATAGALVQENDREGLAELMSIQDQLIVFPCGNAVEASRFTEIAGTYFRMRELRTYDRRRRFFHVFPDFGIGDRIDEVETASIRPVELMNGNTMIAGRGYTEPMLCGTFRFD